MDKYHPAVGSFFKIGTKPPIAIYWTLPPIQK